MAHITLPYRGEYFAEHREKRCRSRACRGVFESNTLRLALRAQPTPLAGDTSFLWYHFACFFKLHEPECVGDIEHFELLRWEDQERIKQEIEKLSASTNTNSGGVNQNKSKDSGSTNKKFLVEYSKSSRAKCRKCAELIKKDKIRVRKTHGGAALWYHLECFTKVREALGFVGSGEKLDGIETLADSDKTAVKNALSEVPKKAADKPADGISRPNMKNTLPKIELDDEALKAKKLQNEKMFELRDQLRKLTSYEYWSVYEKLMKENGLDIPKNGHALDRLADAMIFGSLKRCPTCEKGQLEFRLGSSGMSYYCSHEDEWTRCGAYFDEPPRVPFVVPEDVMKNMKNDEKKTEWENFLKKYNTGKIEKRIFERNPPSASTIAWNEGLQPRKGIKLKSTSVPSTSIKLRVEDGAAVDPQCTNAENKRVYRDHSGNPYSASLTLTDLQAGKNSYCNIQVLESCQVASGSPRSFWFFQSWGEIGMPGLCKEEYSSYVSIAVNKFESVFVKQTGNAWAQRRTFQKVPSKKVLLDLSYGQNVADDDDTSVKDNPSTLEKPVQEIVKLIFSRTLMKNAAQEMELDLNKMPLGKLSKKQIQQAYDVLAELQDHIQLSKQESRVVDQKTVVALSNKFYSLIPHKFTTMDSLLLDTIAAIQKKLEMLDSLKEIEIAYSLMLKHNPTSAKSVIDSRYEELKTKLRPIKATESVFEILKQCVQKTHAQTHSGYKLDIVQVFEVERQGEDERSEPFKTMHNKRLLWHGSAVTNFAGILSQGLRISPPGAPRHGLMFGEGIYFADMVSKAANYCFSYVPNNSDNIGLLLLCEVTLGHMKHLFVSENTLKKPPRGYNSVKGVGRTEPSPFDTRELYDGVTIALGRGVPTSINPEFVPFTTLLYNEYIVYDVAQVKIKYLLQVKYNSHVNRIS